MIRAGLVALLSVAFPAAAAASAGPSECVSRDSPVVLADFAAFQVCYSGPGVPYGSGCGIFDADLDGDVDGHDLRVFLVLLDGRADFDHDLDIDADDWAPFAECPGGPGVPLSADGTGDGWVDAADFALWAACSTAPGLPVGGPCAWSDLDGDGDADVADYARLTLQAGLGLDPACRPGDLDADGDVDLADGAVFQQVFTGARGGSPTAVNPFFFTGQRVDALDPIDPDLPATPANARLVLYDYKARVYDPRHGRFQQRDPSEFADTYNLYEYAASRVTVLTDPTGEFSLPEISLSSLISRGLQALNAASTARDVLLKARALAAGASFQSVLLAFVVEQALDKVGGDAFERALKLVQSVGQATRRAVFSTTAGKLAETAAGIKGPKIAIEVGGNIRIPDSLSRELLQEVKFTTSGKLGITDQLRDFIDFAKSTGRKMELIVPEGTEIVGELRDAWLRGDLEIKFELP